MKRVGKENLKIYVGMLSCKGLAGIKFDEPLKIFIKQLSSKSMNYGSKFLKSLIVLISNA